MTAVAMFSVRATARALIGALAAGSVLCVSGCHSMDDYSGPRTLIPARTLNVSPSLTIPAEAIVAGGIIYAIIDPLAPNWKVEVEPLGTRRYRVNMTMKRFFTGGEGESNWVFRRAAEKLQHEGGFAEYEILSYSEGIESKVTIAQRVASGVVELR
ncbi:MAG: hypothetical protein JWO70_4887 [Betaproteobacteria bacterium]|jgi:hypothetical protein|nr:hypothetical protein [Betaproteobacteria bacterium]